MTEVFVIAQGGGPTAVINATVAGAAREIGRRYPGATVIGARHGVRGIRDNDFIDLTSLSDHDLETLATTPSAAFGSTRDKPDGEYCSAILDRLKKIEATAFIYIGGNDTAGTLKILDDVAAGSIAFLHAPKTIDNDLTENDHTPGYISAAWFVASAFHSCDLDVRALPGIYVGIVMGRNAGFLTAAAAAWRRDESDGPHLLYLPERTFSTKRFLEDIAEVRDRYGRCVVAMSEGVEGEDGRPLVETLLGARVERDAHGNVRLGGGDLGIALQNAIAEAFPGVRARVDTFGYLPRAFATMISGVDRQEAFEAGVFAVATKHEGSGSIALGFDNGRTALRRVPLDAVAGRTRLMPSEFVEPAGTRLSAAGMAYLARLIPPAPETFRRGFDDR